MAVEKKVWRCACVHAPEQHNRYFQDCNILGCHCKGPFDPAQDIDCTRCHTTVSWGDEGPPEDPNERLCSTCAWKELRELRLALLADAGR